MGAFQADRSGQEVGNDVARRRESPAAGAVCRSASTARCRRAQLSPGTSRGLADPGSRRRTDRMMGARLGRISAPWARICVRPFTAPNTTAGGPCLREREATLATTGRFGLVRMSRGVRHRRRTGEAVSSSLHRPSGCSARVAAHCHNSAARADATLCANTLA